MVTGFRHRALYLLRRYMRRVTMLFRFLAVGVMLAASLSVAPRSLAQQAAAPACEASIPQASGNLGALASAGNRFGFSLFGRLSGGEASGNVFISPMSVALALDMAYNGARGSTRQAMARALDLQGMSQPAVRRNAAALLRALQSADPQAGLTVANSLWARSGVPFKRQFLQDARDYYGARVSTLDFRSPSAPATINSWVQCATQGKIPSIVDRIPPSMVMYLINAVYFRGKWTHPFLSARTHPQPFTTGNGQTKSVPLMSQSGMFPYLQGPDFQAISLAYSSGRFSMVVVLPRQGMPLQTFGKRLTAATWQSWTSQLKTAEGSISLPRFTLTNTFQLESPLAGLGMSQAFSRSANFSGICTGSCRISQVRHKTYLSVYEEGTTAAAVTSVGVGATLAPQQRFTMLVNRPFFLAIRDEKTNAMLFLGAVSNPS